MRSLRRVRLSRGWTLREIAVRTGINESTLSKLEHGVWPVYPSWSRRLVNLLKIPAGELFADVAEGEARADGRHQDGS
jgi:transcriptional regulator with XRE-family HTH domain